MRWLDCARAAPVHEVGSFCPVSSALRNQLHDARVFRHSALERVLSLVHAVQHSAEMRLFGSATTMLSLPESDLDVELIVTQAVDAVELLDRLASAARRTCATRAGSVASDTWHATLQECKRAFGSCAACSGTGAMRSRVQLVWPGHGAVRMQSKWCHALTCAALSRRPWRGGLQLSAGHSASVSADIQVKSCLQDISVLPAPSHRLHLSARGATRSYTISSMCAYCRRSRCSPMLESEDPHAPVPELACPYTRSRGAYASFYEHRYVDVRSGLPIDVSVNNGGHANAVRVRAELQRRPALRPVSQSTASGRQRSIEDTISRGLRIRMPQVALH